MVQVSGTREPVKRGAEMKQMRVLEGEEGGFSVLIDR